VRIGLRGRVVGPTAHRGSNLVFLIDVSGSMQTPERLPLVQDSLRLLVAALDERDFVSIVVYAGRSGLVLPPTSGAEKSRILQAVDGLQTGIPISRGEEIRLAYDTATARFIKGGNNRVILATDGDFNFGILDGAALENLIHGRARTGVFLSVLGYGMGNHRDSTPEALARVGNGNYAYIESLRDAREALVERRAGTRITIARDVKIEVVFDPTQVAGYRLIGYENRRLDARGFEDDRKDAGDLGAGHAVTDRSPHLLHPTNARSPMWHQVSRRF
jgi:Ca-activated chloride channel family protein